MNIAEAKEVAEKAERYVAACALTGNTGSVMCKVAASIPLLVAEIERLTERLTKSGDALAEMAQLSSRYDSQRISAKQERDDRDATLEEIAAILDGKAAHYAQNKHLGPYSAELAATVRAKLGGPRYDVVETSDDPTGPATTTTTTTTEP